MSYSALGLYDGIISNEINRTALNRIVHQHQHLQQHHRPPSDDVLVLQLALAMFSKVVNTMRSISRQLVGESNLPMVSERSIKEPQFNILPVIHV